MKNTRINICLAFLVIALSGCSDPPRQSDGSLRPTTFHVGDWVKIRDTGKVGKIVNISDNPILGRFSINFDNGLGLDAGWFDDDSKFDLIGR